MPSQKRDAKVAIVTGGATGIGEAAVAGLADAGWHVWALGRRRSALDALEASTSAKGLVCDVSVGSDVDAAVAHILELEGRLDGLVLNAGTMVEGTLGDTSVEQWDQAVPCCACLSRSAYGIERFCREHFFSGGLTRCWRAGRVFDFQGWPLDAQPQHRR